METPEYRTFLNWNLILAILLVSQPHGGLSGCGKGSGRGVVCRK